VLVVARVMLLGAMEAKVRMLIRVSVCGMEKCSQEKSCCKGGGQAVLPEKMKPQPVKQAQFQGSKALRTSRMFFLTSKQAILTEIQH
jgi:hypothetical protein